MGTSELKKNKAVCATIRELNNEHGVALILVLIVLVLLSILGFTVLTTSTSELKIVGNNRNLQNAFFTADSAVDFALTNANIYTFIIPGSENSWPRAGEGTHLDANGNHTDYNDVTIGDNTAQVKVDYIETGAVPAGIGSEVDAGLGPSGGFKANYFTVSVVGSGPNNAQAEIESYVARIVPK